MITSSGTENEKNQQQASHTSFFHLLSRADILLHCACPCLQRRAVAELSLATFERTLVRTLAARPETKDLAKQVKAVTAAAAEASLPAAAEHARVVEELLKERAELRDELRNAQDEVQVSQRVGGQRVL